MEMLPPQPNPTDRRVVPAPSTSTDRRAEVWKENGEILILKFPAGSSFSDIHDERLSPEGLKNEPYYELKSDEIVARCFFVLLLPSRTQEFEIDIIKIPTSPPAQNNINSVEQYLHSNPNQSPPSAGCASSLGRRPLQASGRGAFPFVQGSNDGAKRPPRDHAPSLEEWLAFDHILSRFQGELQKSCETSAKLHNLTGAMSDILDTIGRFLYIP
ncbi:hypothetical protein PILCRDRAFT_12373 [Piloderma croceum F 1598]|uniref:Uncharacterized protein n=1 Tax=Piloderma croceum (strain F 1598) TaxID=765440 RepID=A0A0C3FBC6_PILCF|nr:hypothetical protein PILCRDRAFT_12373 [Piloderma croceum F 1598]